MKQSTLFFLSSLLLLVGAVGIYRAFADQKYIPQGASANFTRPCNLAGISAQPVVVTATTAKTATATGVGVVRIACTSASHMLQGLTGVTGVTALTGSTLIPANVPEKFLADHSTFAFLRDTADGVCTVTECD